MSLLPSRRDFRHGGMLLALGLGGLGGLAAESVPLPASFRYRATLTGTFVPDAPVRVPLSRQVLASTRELQDLRVFSRGDALVPHALRTDMVGESEQAWFDFKIVGYQESGSQAEILLERPDGIPSFEALTVDTANRNFHRQITLQVSPDSKNWQTAESGAIYDFSSRIALRHTTLRVATHHEKFLKLVLQRPVEAAAGTLGRQYKDLRLQTDESGQPPFRINACRGAYTRRLVRRPDLHWEPLPGLSAQPAADGSSIVPLGELNLPLQALRLRLDAPLYYRDVEIQAADRDDDRDYQTVARGAVHRLPSLADTTEEIACPSRQRRFWRLRIVNGDNPPLAVQGAEIAWAGVSLYFVPVAGRGYELYCGNPLIKGAAFDVDRLLPQEMEQPERYPALPLGRLVENPRFDQRLILETVAPETQRRLMIVIVGLVVVLAAIWLFFLLRRGDAQAPPD